MTLLTPVATKPSADDVKAAASRVEDFLSAMPERQRDHEIGYLANTRKELRLRPADLQVLVNAAQYAQANPPTALIIERTPVQIDFEGAAAERLTDITGALIDANAPMCHPDGELMSAVEQIAYLGERAALAESMYDALVAVQDEAAGNNERPRNPAVQLPAPVLAKVFQTVGAYKAAGAPRAFLDLALASGSKAGAGSCGE